MKLRFLGTGAADWNIANRREGMEWRRFSSVLVDDTLLIDPGPHIYDYAESADLPHLFEGVRDVIITHSHPDHFNCKTLMRVCSGSPGCRVWGDAASQRLLTRTFGESCAIDFRVIAPGREFSAGKYHILALRSNHGTDDADEITLNYAIEADGRRLFYGLDTGWLPYETWCRIRHAGFDCMVFELTMGDIVPGDDRIFGHTSIPMLEIMLQTMRRQGCMRPGCRAVVSHLARTLHTDHASTCARLAPLGVDVAYDGMIYEF